MTLVRVIQFLLCFAIISLIYFLSGIIRSIYTIPDDVIQIGGQSDDADFRLGQQTEDLFWFVQVSDLHLSAHVSKEHSDRQLKNFCAYLRDTISPSVVLASGDLTDAKTRSGLGSHQIIEEWRTYYRIWNDCGFNSSTFLDIRGNHDTFDVLDDDDDKNYYKKFSVQGPEHPRSYLKYVKRGNKTYAFIAVDATQQPGPKRPFNFIGILSQRDFDEISELGELARQNSHYLIWFGHYPTSCVFAPRPGLRAIMNFGLAYLCGHLHTLHNMVPHMYTRQVENGMLELELGDWKDNRYFRVMAIDHGLFSFHDMQYKESSPSQPVILVTNPKDSTFLMPSKEPLYLMRKSTHIRVLVFGRNIGQVRALIEDDNGDTKESIPCASVSSGYPLFVCPWNPTPFSSKSHRLTVSVSVGNQVYNQSHSFILEGSISAAGLGVMGRILLMSNWMMITQAAFGIATFLLVSTLCFFKLICILSGPVLIRSWMAIIPFRRLRRFVLRYVRKLCYLVSLDRIFTPLMIYTLYLPAGPWTIGYMMSERLGVLFAWGMIVDGSYLPADTTYTYGLINILLGQIPLIFLCANAIERKLSFQSEQDRRFSVCENSGWIIFMLTQLFQMVIFYSSYGTLAALGPIRSGTIILAFYLWFKIQTLNNRDFEFLRNSWQTT